jgi:hypothetical protein
LNAFLQERRQYIPLLSLIASLLNLRAFLQGQDAPFSAAYFLSVCFVLGSYGLLYTATFWALSALSPRLPLAVALLYALLSLGAGSIGGLVGAAGPYETLIRFAVLGLLLLLAMTSRLMDPLERLRLPRNLLWPFALFCAGYAFLGLTVLREAHWLAVAAAHLPVAAAFAFFLFLSDRLHLPRVLNWSGLLLSAVLALMGLGPHIPLEPPPTEGKGQNFLFITVEGLRHDAVAPAVMPNTAALARRGFLFTGMYGVSPSVGPNLRALMVRHRDGAEIALAALLPDRWTREALLPAGLDEGMHDLMGAGARIRVQGRRPFVSQLWRAWVPAAIWVRPDRTATEAQVTEAARALLESSSRPFAVWLHLDFPSMGVPAGTVAAVRSGVELPGPALRAPYGDSLRRLDSALGDLFRWLEGRPWADRTNILLLGVSGMELGEHGSAGGGHAYYEESVRFPFLWVGPSVRPGAAPTAISIMDSYPTLVKAFNLAEKPKAFAGMDIASAFHGVFPADRVFPLSGNSAFAPGRAVVAGGFKLIQPPYGEVRLFDLAADPGERTDLACADPARVEQMKGLLP